MQQKKKIKVLPVNDDTYKKGHTPCRTYAYSNYFYEDNGTLITY